MQTRINSVVLVFALTVATTCLAGEFIPGHVYVTLRELEACKVGLEWIVEVDPATGETSIFADSVSDGLCRANGLTFTPDGSFLRLANRGRSNGTFGWISEFDADGSGMIVLDQSDGLGGPEGWNCVTYDTSDNFYVVDIYGILRFPADGGPAKVFADYRDGVFGLGALAFAPNGDLFFTSENVEAIMRITPDGEASVFDILSPETGEGVPHNLAFDSKGNLFAVTRSHIAPGNHLVYAIYRYDNAESHSRRLLAEGFFEPGYFPTAIAVSPDDTHPYFGVGDWEAPVGYLYGVDPNDGTSIILADFSVVPSFYTEVAGIAVYDPAPPTSCEGDANADGTVDPLDSGFVLARFGCAVGVGDPDCDAADQNDDGTVDPLDVGFVLARFGECP